MSRIGLAAALLMGCLSADVRALDWIMDPVGSELGFTATFENVPAPGLFRKFSAAVQFDPDRLAQSRIDVTVAVSSADMSSDDINTAIRGPEWFDVERFPVAEFHSTEVRAAGGNGYLAAGTLRIKDVTRPIAVPFNWKREADTASMNGELAIDRAAFRIGLGEWVSTKVIGPGVKVNFTLRLRKSG